MKKIMILAASAVVTLGIGSTVFAVDSATLKDQAGITPDSILYPADKAVDGIKVILSFSDEAKADTLSDIAEERLGESEIMVNNGDQALANTAINDYKNYMNAAENKIENAITNNQATDNQDKLKKLEDVENKITDKEKKSLDVLAKLQNKVGDKAKVVIAKVIEMQTAKRNAILAVRKERIVYNDAKKQYNEAKVALEKAKKSGDETAITSAEDLLQQKQQILDTEKQNLAKAVQAKKEASKISVGKLIKEAKTQKKKSSKHNGNTQSDKANTTTATTTTTTAADTTTTTNTTAGDTATGSTATKPTSVISENAKKQTVKPAVKSEIKKEADNNKNKENNQNKATNNNGQKNEEAQH